MRTSRQLEQHVAVFGESGSGKTVLLSSFYGAAQEPQNIKLNGFNVVAESLTEGNRLAKNYLGRKKSASLPEANRFSANAYSFFIKVRREEKPNAAKNNPYEALKLVWHDYPGEWFEGDVSGPEEARRRVEAFRALLSSDVALLLVDGEQLLANAGEEERYLKSLITGFRNGLLLLKDDVLEHGHRLVKFPRIWVLGLSKADLLPEMSAFDLRDLFAEKAGEDLAELREVISQFVQSSEALSVGEDFVLLSSAKFEPGRIQIAERIGLDLILPLASVLPLERHVRWAQVEGVAKKVAEDLLQSAAAVAAALGAISAFAEKLLKNEGKVLHAMGAALNLLVPILTKAVEDGARRMKRSREQANVKHNSLAAVLSGFEAALRNAEEDEIFLRSAR